MKVRASAASTWPLGKDVVGHVAADQRRDLGLGLVARRPLGERL